MIPHWTMPRILPVILFAAQLLNSTAAIPADAPRLVQPITHQLADPPVAPKPSEVPWPEFAVQAFPAGGLVIDTQDREAVRVFYRGLFFQSENLPMGWTGDYGTCNAGITNQLFQDAVALRINWHRAMAGVPANISLYGLYNSKNQQAALIMSANSQLNHFPPSTWTCYSADGYEAAGKSNLALGRSGADSVTNGYMRDNGSNNAPVGHRRWVLYPQTQFMGTGDVPGVLNSTTVLPANTLWVIDSNVNATRPTTREGFVAWPPKGYVPYPVVFGRWSLSYPNADFTNAVVSVSKGGTSIPVSIEFRSDSSSANFGEDSIVWLLSGFNDASVWPRPTADDTYSVTVSNVLVGSSLQSFSYNVVVMDPDVVTPGAPVATVSAPSTGIATVPLTATVASMPNATGYEVDLHRATAFAGALTPSNSASSWTQTVSGYNALASSEFQLRHDDSKTQQLQLNKVLFVGQSATLSFDSRFGYATTSETAKVQLSLDGGNSWQDIHVQSGIGSPAASAVVTIDLLPFVGRMIQLRFQFVATGSFYVCTDCGWFFNNVALNNVSELSLSTWTTLTSTQLSTSLTPPSPGNYIVLARPEYQGTYFGDWGPGSAIQVTAGDVTAPSVPTGLAATAVSASRIDLAWTAATDNVAVTAYAVYRGGVFRATVTGATSFSDTGLNASTLYSYAVAACDAAGNCSAQSAPVSATTQAVTDTQAPTVPTGLAATATSSSQITLTWSAASDNVGVVSYRVYRDGAFHATVYAPTVAFNDSALTASTTYGYTVAACDAAGNCSAQSASASATTLVAGSASFSSTLKRGWNLIGNSLQITLSVDSVFGSPTSSISGVTGNINSVWKWNASVGNWQFYSPGQNTAQNQAFADANGFEVLSNIEPGAGYWVNVKSSAPLAGVTLATQSGTPVVYEAANTVAGTPAKIAGRNLATGWQLVAIADALTPSQFNENISGTPPSPNLVKLSFQSLWAWDAALGTWYFYAPQLEKDGVAAGQGLALVKQFADNNGFLHFEDFSKTLDVGVGFWLRK